MVVVLAAAAAAALGRPPPTPFLPPELAAAVAPSFHRSQLLPHSHRVEDPGSHGRGGDDVGDLNLLLRRPEAPEGHGDVLSRLQGSRSPPVEKRLLGLRT